MGIPPTKFSLISRAMGPKFGSTALARQQAAQAPKQEMPDARIFGKTLLLTSEDSEYAGQIVQQIVWDSDSQKFKNRLDQYDCRQHWGGEVYTAQGVPLGDTFDNMQKDC